MLCSAVYIIPAGYRVTESRSQTRVCMCLCTMCCLAVLKHETLSKPTNTEVNEAQGRSNEKRIETDVIEILALK